MDRSGQGVGAIFEKGQYFELSYGLAMPSVSGVGIDNAATPTTTSAATGNVAPDYASLGFALKMDVNDKVSLAIIMDEPFGAEVDYSTAGYVLNGAGATVETSGITVLAKYQLNENMSVYAGPRMISASGEYNRAVAGQATAGYSATYDSGSDTGYVVGAAYEIPSIALRAALTYSSETNFTLDGTRTSAVVGAGTTTLTATMPQSVNLDFQTGIAADTLLMASVRWADWSEGTLDDSFLGTAFGGGDANLADFNNTDTYTYSLGVARRFNEKFAGVFSVGYEAAQGGTASNLSPTDGYTSYSLGGVYNVTEQVKVSGGIRYVDLGDATTEGVGGRFSGNSATGLGLKVSYSF